MPRRRYNTEALVGEMKREKRNAILLSLIGFGLFAFLVVYFLRLRGPAVPQVPTATNEPMATAAAGAAGTPGATGASGQTTAGTGSGTASGGGSGSAGSVKPASAQDALVEISLPKPGPVLVDGEVVAKKAKDYEAKLAPGKHKVGTKIGRKTVTINVETVAGKHYRVDLDPKKKKGGVEEVSP
jgi:hypothetical protein